ncbi:type I-C CRISPR-associated protein Cas5c [Brevibacillus laterosporus]|uniref:type I-C CRISPR-associated protein Cas5c n=1 Tax=Brevibacillus laterosporus TaxID=1465 RepID=UPI0011277626|nr:type I-C CRISPR-associated protein Cas5c [Brevibacillus laterosporus]MBG9801662.1 CRISPR-associated protein [Brevibacillus laterosporus]MED2003025.1 type I-C CRISPR-associated protein Cas5c [Brevibacillus laterosporus]MED4762160.1 type I-C CRISPR-associated protein Cas5c [Brevibacillus laterosporus]TPH10694.1 type I-C CRISPR-associated protein Cas5 [Brevibacillus laterosporus]
MVHGVQLHVWGEYACFTRQELKPERGSYDVITPTAARGILEAILWKPSMNWIVDRIHVLNEIKFATIRRNELSNTIPSAHIKNAIQNDKPVKRQDITKERQQRSSMILKNPAYVIEAHVKLTPLAYKSDTTQKFLNMFVSRAKKGQCFHIPYLGCREFAANFSYVEKDDDIFLQSFYRGIPDKDLGLMLWDLNYQRNREPFHFHAKMCQGVIDLSTSVKKEGKEL